MNNKLENFDQLDFPATPEEAQERFQYFEYIDPLPDVNPALLNSGDIFDYARITGMIWPFANEEGQLKKKLKPASYEIDFLGTVYFIDDQGESRKIEIEKDVPFPLKKNSIAYLYIATTFRLPAYIALRFNLKITHVHRGLLLGTGPLVDPGFCGQLLIPLHNLTSENYTIKGGDGVIWVEFTKLSPHLRWNHRARKNANHYIQFPTDKRYLPAQAYLNKATVDGQPAKSSIPGEVKVAKEDALNAKNSAERSEAQVKRLAFLGAIGGGIALLSLIVGLVALVYNTWSFVNETKKDVMEIKRDLSDFRITVDDKFKQIDTNSQKQIASQKIGTVAPDKTGLIKNPKAKKAN